MGTNTIQEQQETLTSGDVGLAVLNFLEPEPQVVCATVCRAWRNLIPNVSKIKLRLEYFLANMDLLNWARENSLPWGMTTWINIRRRKIHIPPSRKKVPHL